MRILFLISLLSFNVFAGEKGNGGDVILCPGTNRAELYDHYEGRHRDNREIDLGHPSLSVEEKVELVLNRLSKFDLERTKNYRAWAKSFMSEAQFLRGIDLIDIPDTGDGYVPMGCILKQLIVQKTTDDPMGNGKRYTVNADYWDRLDNDGKAGTILHEVILREFIGDFKQEDSRATRYFNSWVSSRDFETLTWRGYALLLARVNSLVIGAPYGNLLRRSFLSRPDSSGSMQPPRFKAYLSSDEGVLLTDLTYTYDTPVSKTEIVLNEEKIKVELKADRQVFVLNNGLLAGVNLVEPLKMFDFSNNWSIKYIGKTMIKSLGADKYQVAGSSDDVSFSHPGFSQNCRKSQYSGKKVFPYPGIDLVAYDFSETKIKDAECTFWQLQLKTNLFEYSFNGPKLKIQDDGFNGTLSNIGFVKFPLQNLNLSEIKLAFGVPHRVVEAITSGYQTGLNVKKQKIQLYDRSRITFNSDGLILTCVRSDGKKCK